MKKNIFFFVLSILFILFSLDKSFAYEKRAYYHDVPDNIEILFPKQSLKKWLSYIYEIKKNKIHITEKFKKSFKIKGHYLINDQRFYFSGKARITGDWTDHINFKKNYSSLSISLKKGNIGGITKFRLLIPLTRHGVNEIFWTTLMNEIGFFSPHRQLIKAKLQTQNVLMIFEEKPEKEFLESRGFRDTPSIEFDERQNWENEKYKKTISKNLTQLKIKNRNFLKNQTSLKIAMRSLYYPFVKKNKDYHDLYEKINTPEAIHGIDEQNGKFIYDGIFNAHYPIYFDGDVNFDNSNCDENIKPIIPDNLKLKMVLLETKYNKYSLGKDLTDQMLCVAINKMLMIENFKKFEKEMYPLENFEMNQIDVLKNDNSYKKKNPVTKINNNFDTEKCFFLLENNQKFVCKKNKFSLNEVKNILSGDDEPEIYNKYKLYHIHNYSFLKEKIEKFEKLNLENENNFPIIVNKNETKFIKADIKNSSIKIFLNDHTSKIVFYNSKINDSSLITDFLETTNSKEYNESRFDERLLTSCKTIIDSKIINSSLIINNCKNEDSINFIRSKGFNNNVYVKNSKYDAVDLDFSNLFFREILIENSGNDCLDVSGGIYNIQFLYGKTCYDKGLSVGEKSQVAIKKLHILDSKIGFAVKDSSILYISKGKFNNNKNCGEIYNKKQEFGLSKLFINKNINCEIKKNKFSEIFNSGICKMTNRNYFFSTCFINNNKIKIKVKNNFPEDTIIQIKNDLSILQEIHIASVKKNECLDNFINCEIEFELKKKPKNNQIKNFYIKLLDKDDRVFLAEKYPQL